MAEAVAELFNAGNKKVTAIAEGILASIHIPHSPDFVEWLKEMPPNVVIGLSPEHKDAVTIALIQIPLAVKYMRNVAHIAEMGVRALRQFPTSAGFTIPSRKAIVLGKFSSLIVSVNETLAHEIAHSFEHEVYLVSCVI
jgi:predicted RNase H-like nuclease